MDARQLSDAAEVVDGGLIAGSFLESSVSAKKAAAKGSGSNSLQRRACMACAVKGHGNVRPMARESPCRCFLHPSAASKVEKSAVRLVPHMADLGRSGLLRASSAR